MLKVGDRVVAVMVAGRDRRGYSPSYDKVLLPDVPSSWARNWTPTSEGIAINRARIAERLGSKNNGG